MKLFDHKECTDSCYNKDEPWKHYAEWKNSDTEGYILYDFIYIKCLEWASYEDKVD